MYVLSTCMSMFNELQNAIASNKNVLECFRHLKNKYMYSTSCICLLNGYICPQVVITEPFERYAILFSVKDFIKYT